MRDLMVRNGANAMVRDGANPPPHHEGFIMRAFSPVGALWMSAMLP
jgi:hypothetical protein